MVHFEVEKHGVLCCFSVPNGTQIGTCFEALQDILLKLKEISDAQAEQEKQKQANSLPVVDMTPEQFRDAIEKAN